ncbi:hypothetical protein KDJ56_20195 [Brevibacillus composti]|uniref:Uncharacterized protein n=1 Tax=Brevibacillus composti TaxID=2796470 RepID=A0A7T5EQ62_9BACL|nr:hypothetical protein [Brevibacillus composti]QQE76744.1 hypothetical protein JD108_20260 [Brevibacillus composti]QUO43812.1 hypothetical protein KDJ56_20195 [Brevibacillus composti]
MLNDSLHGTNGQKICRTESKQPSDVSDKKIPQPALEVHHQELKCDDGFARFHKACSNTVKPPCDCSIFHSFSKPELPARIFNHTTGRNTRGYNMLTLGWSDGFSFAPIDFFMLSLQLVFKYACFFIASNEITSRICLGF